MTTIVDEFVVTLGLDPTQYKKQTAELERQLERDKQTALKSGKLIEDSARKQRQAFNAVKVEALGFMSVIAGAGSLTAFAANTVKTDAAVGRLSATIGQSTKTISLWQAVMRGVGGTNQNAASALSNINQLGVDFLQNRLDPTRVGLLGQLGISPEQLQDPTAFSLAAAGAFTRGDPRIAADRLRRLGFDDSYLAALQGGPAALQGRLKAAGPLAEITAEDAARAQALERSASRFNTAVQGRGRRALGAVLPHATTALNQLADLIEGRTAGPGFMGMPAGGRAGAAAGGGGGGGRGGGGGGTVGSFSGIVSFLTARGVSMAAARGIAAGIGAETGGTFSPSETNPKSGAYGLLQLLTPARRADFERVMKRKLKGSSGEDQLNFMLWEMQNTERTLKGSSGEDQLNFMLWEMQNTERTAGAAVLGASTDVEALSNYVGGNRWGYMRPGAGRDIDMRWGNVQLARNPTVNIGTIVVNTQATDAKGIATGLWSAIPQANTGLH